MEPGSNGGAPSPPANAVWDLPIVLNPDNVRYVVVAWPQSILLVIPHLTFIAVALFQLPEPWSWPVPSPQEIQHAVLGAQITPHMSWFSMAPTPGPWESREPDQSGYPTMKTGTQISCVFIVTFWQLSAGFLKRGCNAPNHTITHLILESYSKGSDFICLGYSQGIRSFKISPRYSNKHPQLN